MASSSALGAVGNGIFVTVSFLYLTRFVALPPTAAGTALTIAGLLSIAVGALVGRVLERTPTVAVNAALLLTQAVAVGALALTGGRVPALLAAGFVALTSKLKLAARGTLIALAFTGPERQAARAWFRSLSNLGAAVGSGLAVIATAADRALAYRSALVAVAFMYVMAAVVLSSMRGSVGAPVRSEGSKPNASVYRDTRYLIFSLLNGLLGVHYLLLEIGLPLWTQREPSRETWLIPAALLLNTLVVVAMQVPISSRIEGVWSALIAQFRAGVLFATFTVGVFAATALPGAWAGIVVLGSVAVYSLGEIVQAAASWELSFELADPRRPGAYQAMFASGANIGQVLAPFIITWVLSRLGDVGWLALGFALCGTATTHLLLSPTRSPAPASRCVESI